MMTMTTESYNKKQFAEVCQRKQYVLSKFGSIIHVFEKMPNRKLFQNLFYFVCVVGLIYQSTLIIQIYVQYKVSSNIHIEFPSTVTPATISLCVRFTDVLDFKKINQVSNRSWTHSNKGQIAQKYQHELTIQEIFKFTPREQEVVKRVVFKTANGSLTVNSNGNDPYQYIVVSKYIYLEYICYMISLKRLETWSFESLAVTPVGSGLIYVIFLTESVTTARFLKFALTQHHFDYPARSIIFSPVIRRSTRNQRVDNEFTNYHYRLFAQRLEYPYETNCLNYHKIDPKINHDVECTQQCILRETVKQLNKFPYSVIISNLSSLNMISCIDMMDKEVRPQVLRIDSDCKHKCRWPSCYDSRIITVTEWRRGTKFQLKHILPTHPSIEVIASPRLSFVEFITYLISTISTWTGFSIMAMNPLGFASKAWQVLKKSHKRTNRLHKQEVKSLVDVKSFELRLKRVESLLANR